MTNDFVPQALETPSTNLVSIDLSCYNLRDGYRATINALYDAIQSRKPALVNRYDTSDIDTCETEDVLEVGEDIVGDLEVVLYDVGLLGYAEDNWYYIDVDDAADRSAYSARIDAESKRDTEN